MLWSPHDINYFFHRVPGAFAGMGAACPWDQNLILKVWCFDFMSRMILMLILLAGVRWHCCRILVTRYRRTVYNTQKFSVELKQFTFSPSRNSICIEVWISRHPLTTIVGRERRRKPSIFCELFWEVAVSKTIREAHRLHYVGSSGFLCQWEISIRKEAMSARSRAQHSGVWVVNRLPSLEYACTFLQNASLW